MNKRQVVTIVASASVAVGASLISFTPASAVGMTCYAASDNGTLATGVCSGVGAGYAQLNVTCNAIWPFPVWTDFGPWVWINGSMYLSNSHAFCAAPLTLWYATK